MRKQWIGLAVAVTMTACAAAPEVTPVPDRPAEPRPERPAEPARREAPLRIGVIVSSSATGILRQYADLVLDGARVGAAAAGTATRDVELVVRDDGGTAAGAARALRELEQAGVRVVVGPLIEDGLAAAARARSSDALTLISPTSTTDAEGLRNVYALNIVDARGSAALGEHARRFTRVGVLHSRTAEAQRQARAFTEAYSRGGHGAVTAAVFDSGATNLTRQITQLRQARVQAVYVPGSPRELQVVLPQVEYAGLRDVQMFGTESWIGDAGRGLPQRVVEGAIVATSLLRESDAVAWQDFVARYEALHRRTLDNAIPALGYDAALLAARVAGGGSVDVSEYRGATGVLTVRADSVTRRPFLVRIEGGRLVPVN
ncbi:MAG TPA: penicillin-binding protein activator [Longimicrobiales bacterium]|nr:penicillin-binding protein activator [Longimicrobiales bacterium]